MPGVADVVDAAPAAGVVVAGVAGGAPDRRASRRGPRATWLALSDAGDHPVFVVGVDFGVDDRPATLAIVNPKRAGSPTAGGRLKTGTAGRAKPIAPSRKNESEAAPIAVSSEQRLAVSITSLSWLKSAKLQVGRAVRLPVSPAGSGKRVLRGLGGLFDRAFVADRRSASSGPS